MRTISALLNSQFATANDCRNGDLRVTVIAPLNDHSNFESVWRFLGKMASGGRFVAC